jgi:hypothetical protein
LCVLVKPGAEQRRAGGHARMDVCGACATNERFDTVNWMTELSMVNSDDPCTGSSSNEKFMNDLVVGAMKYFIRGET